MGPWMTGSLGARTGRIPWLHALEGIESQEGCRAGKGSPSQIAMARPGWMVDSAPQEALGIEGVLKQAPFWKSVFKIT